LWVTCVSVGKHAYIHIYTAVCVLRKKIGRDDVGRQAGSWCGVELGDAAGGSGFSGSTPASRVVAGRRSRGVQHVEEEWHQYLTQRPASLSCK
jgi:hypothetical protein